MPPPNTTTYETANQKVVVAARATTEPEAEPRTPSGSKASSSLALDTKKGPAVAEATNRNSIVDATYASGTDQTADVLVQANGVGVEAINLILAKFPGCKSEGHARNILLGAIRESSIDRAIATLPDVVANIEKGWPYPYPPSTALKLWAQKLSEEGAGEKLAVAKCKLTAQQRPKSILGAQLMGKNR